MIEFARLGVDEVGVFREIHIVPRTSALEAIGEDTGTVEEVYEPYLIMEGFIKRTQRGRMVTPLAYQHLGRPMIGSNAVEPGLFD